MFGLFRKAFSRLVPKLIFSVGTIFFLSLSTWGYFNINYLRDEMMDNITAGADRLSNTIRLGTHYAMMLNSRDDIQQIINNVARQHEIQTIRIYNKQGEIKFSNKAGEIDKITNIKDEACFICHRSEPPLATVGLVDRVRLVKDKDGRQLLGVISPVFNEPGCAAGGCHVHPADKKVLGALDLVVSLEETDQEISRYENTFIVTMLFLFLITSAIIGWFLNRFVNHPIKKLIRGTRNIARGDYHSGMDISQSDEMGQLAEAINKMGQEIGAKQDQLNKQKVEYQTLFEQVPCIISVQDKAYRLIGYNREFADTFGPELGEHCYRVYKGRDHKCDVCPVEKTFADGQSHYSEESGPNQDGIVRHWIVRTTPIRNENGDIVAAMEMNLDITQRKQLEDRLEKSEKKYYEIFHNIPNPVFMMDSATLEILDCNVNATTLYGYSRDEIIGMSFLHLFADENPTSFMDKLNTRPLLDQIMHRSKSGEIIFVTIRVSPSAYHSKQILLVTVSDVTKRLETEQQLIQASKMATLGEMATGVAHELNQPLSVIKTASNYFMRKIKRKQSIPDDILLTMSSEIDSHVERATKIINHMRQFGRKSEILVERMHVNDVMQNASEIFSQQLRARGIEVVWDLCENLPAVTGDSHRLEQVFINLVINARDAIDEKERLHPQGPTGNHIHISTKLDDNKVVVKVCDSGLGIPDQLLNKVFEPFFTTKKVGKGTGLGLSISYGIIKEFGGRINVRHNESGGACFIIKFPIPEENNE